MKFVLCAAFIAAIGVAGAAASESADKAAPHQDDAGRLVAHARMLKAEKGCGEAAPAFRVAAAMGEGEEAAQHELGECLLELQGASEAETLLFRREGEFWLTRAAFAGNARAQRKLAMETASPASPSHDARSALKWALVYSKNPDAELYGYKALPATLAPGLKASLSPAAIAEAEAFAEAFRPIRLAKYEAPRPRKGGKDERRLGPAPEGPEGRRPPDQ